MSLKSLEATINGNREQAVKLREQLNASVGAIRANGTLSVEGKQNAIASQYFQTASKVTALGEGEEAALEKAATELNRKLFGQFSTDTSSIIAFRDAQDRAERLESRQDAKALLDRAQLSNDTTLAAAVFARAISSGWTDVVSKYAAANPEQASAMEDLANIERFRSDVGVGMHHAMSYSTPSPAELNGLSRAQLDLASGGI